MMYKKNSIFRNTFFNAAIVLLCCISSYVAFGGDNRVYNTLGILPLAYVVIYLFSVQLFKERVFGNIGYVLFWGQSIVKCVIAPLILCLGNYVSLFPNLTGEYIFGAVLLMIYEQVVCTLIIGLAFPSKKRWKIVISKVWEMPKMAFGAFVMLFAVVICAIWFLVPSVKNNFVTIFDMLSSQEMFTGYDYTSINAPGGITRILTTLFLVLFKSFRVIFPFYIIKALKQKYDSGISFLLSIIVIMLQFLFISETVAMALVVALILLSYMFRIYPKYKKAIIGLMAVSSVFVVFVLSLNFENMSAWYGVRNVTEYASQVLQAYVPGVCNTASIFRLERVSRISALWDTLVSCIPFQSTLFGSAGQSNDLNTLFTSVRGLNAQICSTIGGGWYIFGAFGAPLFSGLFTYVSMINGYRYAQTDDEVEKLLYLYTCVQSILGIGVYNIQITVALWIQVVIVLYIGTKLAMSRKRGHE